jgi:16S rRNA processing protein RimM
MSERVLLGEIVSAQGIKGEVVIRSYAEPAEGIGSYGALTDAAGRTINITVVRASVKGVVARVAGVEDRTGAEQLRGSKLYVERARLPDPEPNAYYHLDLVGLEAVDLSGAAIGTITGVHNYGAGDFLEVALTDRKDTELVPFTAAFVPSVDLARRRITLILASEEAGEDEKGD